MTVSETVPAGATRPVAAGARSVRRMEIDMGIWLITDPKLTRILGTVEASNEVEAAGRTDLGQAEWFWQSEPGPNDQLAVYDVASLAGDYTWRELGASTPLPGGDCGGDGQDSPSYARRFGLVRADGNWAVVTLSWYAVNDGLRRCDGLSKPEDFWLERQMEAIVSGNVHDLGGTEVWSDYVYAKETDFPISEQGAILAAAAFDPEAGITWSGRDVRGLVQR